MIKDKLKVFYHQLLEIKNKEIKEIAEKTIESTPDWYFEMPASTSGKNHSEEDCKTGGQILHLKKAFVLAKAAIYKNFLDNNPDRDDIILASTLIHDMPYKFVWSTEKDGYVTDKLHPFVSAGLIWEANKSESYLTRNKFLVPIVVCVYHHMGRWGDYRSKTAKAIKDRIGSDFDFYSSTMSRAIMCVHEADYWASRRDITVEVEDNLCQCGDDGESQQTVNLPPSG